MGADREYYQALCNKDEDKDEGKVVVELSAGTWVTAHMASGDQPAVVTRGNPDGSASLTIFGVGEMVFRDNVHRYEFDEDDLPEDKIGFFS